MGSKARTLRPTRDQSLENIAPESVPILFPAFSPPGVRLPADRVALVPTGVGLPEVTHPALMACGLAPGTRNQAQGHACLILGLLDCFFHHELPTVCRDVLTSDESCLPFPPSTVPSLLSAREPIIDPRPGKAEHPGSRARHS